ncbi:uncharacterized protein METZ01_LOCUS136948 [marine metagenome]|uniref:Uncharacterized protein n=1 Tax=marine metagenome TaxID=408172 RepID=A0A381Z4P0_9ZZZZ
MPTQIAKIGLFNLNISENIFLSNISRSADITSESSNSGNSPLYNSFGISGPPTNNKASIISAISLIAVLSLG